MKFPWLPKHLRPGDFESEMRLTDSLPDYSLVYHEAFIGYLDILGYRNLLEQYGDDSPRQIYNNILNPLAWARSSFEIIKVSIFSDTILLEGQDNHPITFWNLLSTVSSIREQLLRNGFLIRGAIVLGQHFDANEIWISPALVKAYELESKIAVYPRILIDPSANLRGQKDIQIKDGKKGIIYHNYFRKIDDFLLGKDFDSQEILKFDPNVVEIRYLKYEIHPDFDNLDKDRIQHCIKAGNQRLSDLRNGISNSLKMANSKREKAKVHYMIDLWNKYIESFRLQDHLVEDYRI